MVAPIVPDTSPLVASSTNSFEVRLHWKRWLVLASFCFIVISNNIIWLGLSPISNLAAAYYDKNYEALNWMTSVFPASFIILFLPCTYAITRFGLKVNLVVAVSLNAVSSALRYAGADRQGFYLMMSGQCIGAIVNGLILQMPPFVSAVWFADNEKGKSTSIGVLSTSVGYTVGFLMMSYTIKPGDSTMVTDQKLHYILGAQMIFAIIQVPLVILFVDRQPLNPPTVSQALLYHSQRHDPSPHSKTFIQSILTLARDVNYHVLLQAYSLLYAAQSASSAVTVEWLIGTFPSKQAQIGLLALVQTVTGILGLGIIGVVLDKSKSYQRLAVVMTVACFIFMALISYGLIVRKSWLLVFLGFIFLGFVNNPIVSVGFEHAVEITYPIPESLSGGFISAFGSAYTFVLITVSGKVLTNKKLLIAGIIFCSVYLVSLFLICISRTKNRRSEAEIVNRFEKVNGVEDESVGER